MTDSRDGYRNNSLRGSVGLAWERAGKPKWDLARTIRACSSADRRLEGRGLNPAKKYRKARLRHDAHYVRQWVAGCRFEWL